jgi:iron complex outermembrane receptor protein
VSGVINIVTYDPLLDNVNAVTVRGGNLAYGGGDAVATQHFGRTIGVRVSVGGWTADGYKDPVATYAPAPRYGSVNFDTRWQVTSGIVLHASGGVTDANTDRAINGAPEEDFQNHFTYWRVGGTAETEARTIDVDAYENRGIDNTRTGPTGGRLTIDTSVYRASDLVRLDANNTIRFGLEYRQDQATSLLILGGTPSYRLYAANGMWDWQISPQFELTNAVRLDHTALHFSGNLLATPGRMLRDYDNSTTTAPSFNSALVIHLTDVDTVRLTLARGLQLPSLCDYAFQIPFDFGLQAPNARPVLLAGSPEVRPTAVWHAEMSYRLPVPAWNANFQTAVFFERNTGLIAPGGSTSFAPVGQYILSQSENIGSSKEAGFEIDLSRRMASGLRWNVSYSYARISDDIGADVAANEITRYSRGTPTHTIVAGIGYSWDRWEADLAGRWQSSYVDYRYPGPFPFLINNYATFNARIAYRVIDGLTVAGVVSQLNSASLLEAAGDQVDRRFIASATLRY